MRLRRYLTIAALTALAAVAAMFVLVCVEAIRFWYPMDVGEGMLLDQVLRLARGRNIYHPLTTPPYVVSSYPPLYMLVQVPFAWMFGPTLVYGRLVSQASAAAAGLFLGLTVFRVTGDRMAGWVSGLLVLGLPVLIFWAQAVRVDELALAFGWAGLFLIARPGSPQVAGGAALIAAAAYTRQTSWLAPFAAAVAHLVSTGRWRDTGRLVVYLGIFSVGALILLEAVSRGTFLANVLSMRGDPWDMSQLLFGYRYVGSEVRFLLPVAALGAILGLLTRRPGIAMALAYLAIATLIGAMYVKVGAYVNYLIEFGMAIVFLAGLALGWTRERPAAGSAVLALVLLQALWTIRVEVYTRPVIPAISADMPALLQVMRRSAGPIVSDAAVSMIALAGHPLYLDSFTLLMFRDNGRWDAAPLMDDLRNKRIQLLALRHTRSGYLPAWWRPDVIAAIEASYVDCGHLPVHNASGDYYVLFRPVCPGGGRPGQIR